MKREGFAALLLAGAFIAGCSGGGSGASSVPVTAPIGQNNASVPAQLLVKSWGSGIMQGATYVGPVSNASLSVNVLVHQQNAAGLVQYAQEANNPGSGNYRKWLTPQQIASRFGATQSDYATVAAYFAKNGLAIAAWPQRMTLVVSGSQSNMQRAFGTTFGLYQRDGKQFVAPKSPPHFQQVLPVDAIGNIANYKPNHTFILSGAPRAGAGYAAGFSPSTIQAAFDYIGPIKSGYNGSGVELAIIGTGPLNTAPSGKGDADLNQYLSETNTTSAASVTVNLVTGSGVEAGLTKSGIPSSEFPYTSDFATATPAPPWAEENEDGEAQLDTQQAATLAPGANVAFYFAYNNNDGCANASFSSPCPSSGANAGTIQYGLQESDAEIQQVIADNTADIISMSYGGGDTQQGWNCNSGCSEPYQGSYSQLEFAALAAEGIAAFAASGDDGSANCFNSTTNLYEPEPCVNYPAGDPNVTSVGGITANVDLTGAITAPWLAWGISTSDNGYGGQEGSGGGTASFLPAPAWQQSAIGATKREQPDVSLDGDPSTGVSVFSEYYGGFSGIGGTSVAAPEMAAMWADVLSACKIHPGSGVCPTSGSGHYWRLGDASPYLYAIYKGAPVAGYTPSLAYTNVFYDIVYGDNEMYSNPGSNTPTPSTPVPGSAAGPGYDEVTGVGVPFGGHLIESLTGLTGIP